MNEFNRYRTLFSRLLPILLACYLQTANRFFSSLIQSAKVEHTSRTESAIIIFFIFLICHAVFSSQPKFMSTYSRGRQCVKRSLPKNTCLTDHVCLATKVSNRQCIRWYLIDSITMLETHCQRAEEDIATVR